MVFWVGRATYAGEAQEAQEVDSRDRLRGKTREVDPKKHIFAISSSFTQSFDY